MTEIILGLSWLLVTIVLLMLMRPSAMEKRGRNAWVGIRIPETVISDEAWIKGHTLAWPGVKAGTALSSIIILMGIFYAVKINFSNDVFYLLFVLSSLSLLSGYLWSIRRIKLLLS